VAKTTDKRWGRRIAGADAAPPMSQHRLPSSQPAPGSGQLASAMGQQLSGELATPIERLLPTWNGPAEWSPDPRLARLGGSPAVGQQANGRTAEQVSIKH